MTTAIDDLLNSWADAERRGDGAALEALMTDDFIGIGPVGFVLAKAAWSARFDQGLHYDSLRLDEVTTRTYADAALVVARQHAEGHHQGTPTPSDLRLSMTLVEQGDQWRIAGLQYSLMAGTG